MIIEFLKKHELLCLFCLVYLVYIINGRTIGAGDTIPASLLPFSILENHNLYLNQFSDYFNSNFEIVFWSLDIDGHQLSFYPIVTPVLITPIYVIPFLVMKLNHIPVDMFHPGFALIVSIMEKLSASLIASLSVIFVFLSSKELINRRIATFVAIIYAFATNTWATSSQALWQHGLVELFLAISIYLVILNEKRKSDKIIISLGIISGLFIFNRPSDGIILLPVIYYMLATRQRSILYYGCAAFTSAVPFLFYNVHYFGNIFGGYSNALVGFDFGSDTVINFIGLLFSPSRGIFIYAPVLLFSIGGFLKIRDLSNKSIRNFLFVSGISILAQVVIYSTFVAWWAGWSYGPRFLTGVLPVLSIYLGLYIKDISFDMRNRKNMLVICIFSFLLIWSVFAQIVGAFYYPNGNWDRGLYINANYTNPDSNFGKLWDWKDTQIMRSFNAGIIPPGNYINDVNIIVNLQRDIVMDGKPGKGWYWIETWDGTSTRWMDNDAQVTLYSPKNRTANLSLRITSFYRPRTLEIYIGNKLAAARGNISSTGFEDMTVPINLANGTNSMRFHVPEGCERPSDKPELKNRDSRCMSLAVQNITIIPIADLPG